MIVQIDGARRANSFNFYKKVTGTDAELMKLLNIQSTQQTFENLAADVTVEITVNSVNDAGEGLASEPVSVVVARAAAELHPHTSHLFPYRSRT